MTVTHPGLGRLGSILFLAALAAFWADAIHTLGWPPLLELHSLALPTPRLVALWSLYGIYGVATLAGLTCYFSSTSLSGSLLASANTRRVLPWLMLSAFTLPLLLRFLVLSGLPLTDDETTYLFSARLLLLGKLRQASPEMPRAFDHIFLINDGWMLGQYFLGWPVVLALAEQFHARDFAAPLLSALSLLPLSLILRRYLKPGLALASLMLYSGSWTVNVMAATLLSHTACNCFLLLFVHLGLRSSEDRDAGAGTAALCALAGATAFFIRPSSTVIVALPLGIHMLMRITHLEQDAKRRVAAFVFVAAGAAAGFLLLNQHLHGSPLSTGYYHFYEFDRSQGYRYFTPEQYQVGIKMTDTLSQPMLVLQLLWGGLRRLSLDGLGWPLPVLLPPLLALAMHRSGAPFVTACTLMLFIHALMRDFGIDSFGPVHLFEALAPLVIALGIGIRNLGELLAARSIGLADSPRADSLAVPFAAAILLSAMLLLMPVRLFNLHLIIGNIAQPTRLAQSLPAPAIIFSPHPFTDQRQSQPRHYLYYPPINSPMLDDRTLWLNDLGERTNCQLIKRFPGRDAYTLIWSDTGIAALRPTCSRSAP